VADINKVEVAIETLLVGGVHDELAVHATDADCAHGAVERECR